MSAAGGVPQFPVTVERVGPLAGQVATAIAVPVKDEAERIQSCLASIAEQQNVDFGDLVVVLLVNNTTDDTVERVRALGELLPFEVALHRAELPPPYANAGWARRLAMDAAADRLKPGGMILTTDADTLVDGDWIEANLREIAAGVDAVAGFVMADPVELMELPPAVLERGSLEWEYQQLAAELEARADPEPHDPWPRHNQNCGASAAVRLDAYRAIGGLPPKRVGEDRALFAELRKIDAAIRHSLDVHVVTSARTDGRASGGMADAIRLRGDPDTPCDELLEVAVVTLRRALWRCELRQAWRAGRLDVPLWARRLRVEPAVLRRATETTPYFGALWAELEGRSPRLVRRLVTGGELKRELRRLRRLVDSARRRETAARVAAETPRRAIG